MRNKIIFTLVGVGVLLALASAYVYARPPKPQSPVFQPASNPYPQGIFANGIIESYQAHGENINIYPDVSGTVREILVAEGESVRQGTPLLEIDNTVQRATTDQQKAQADAAGSLLQELKAQPRKENLEVARAQVELATASLKSAQDTLNKQQHSYDLEPRSVSKDTLDTVRNSVKVAKANLDVVSRQFELTRAGAWTYDIQNQRRQVEALSKAWSASTALLAKYTVRAPTDGVILSIQAALGSYVSSQGAYGTYTQGLGPIIVMGTGKSSGYMSVRCYVDEILIPKLPSADKMVATMSIRGTTTTIPLEFVRLQPYVSPKIELSDQRLEKVDLRVLPAIFRFQPPPDVEVYPGEMVDVYIGARDATAVSAPAALRLKSPLVEYAGDQRATSPSTLLVNRP
ncbi:MAG: biotin/lipoyl-binding protein [Polyangia bacterium]|jgi:HlyD family secretion protein